MEEKTLVQQLIDGHQLAYKALYDLHANHVYHTLFGFVANEDEAEDLVQEVFVTVFQSIHQFKQEAKLSTWIYRIAVNAALQHLRKKNRRKQWLNLVRLVGIENEAEEIEDNNIVNEQEETLKELRKAIEKLPENQRIALTLHNTDGLKYQQIAEIMDMSLSAVESLIFRSKQNLKKNLQHKNIVL